jgi:hypothetical protein
MEIAANVKTDEEYLNQQAKEAAISAKLDALEIATGVTDNMHKHTIANKKIEYDKANNALKKEKK